MVRGPKRLSALVRLRTAFSQAHSEKVMIHTAATQASRQVRISQDRDYQRF